MIKILKQVAFKLFGTSYTKLAITKRQIQTYLFSVCHPYRFDSHRYVGTFIDNKGVDTYDNDFNNKKINRVIYVFWTGTNEITPNRLAGIKSLEEKAGVRVQLITPNNLNEYIVPTDPLPEVFDYLSLNHKSDYLRSYFMCHHGGGYADIKTYYSSWIQAFDKLDNSDAYAIGYPEVGFWGAAYQDIDEISLRNDVYKYWRLLIGNGAFICRPHTRLTEEWYSEAKRRLLVNAEELKKHPAKDFFGSNEDYPLRWSYMQGAIFHPLCLKYHDKLLKDKELMPSFKNYR